MSKYKRERSACLGLRSNSSFDDDVVDTGHHLPNAQPWPIEAREPTKNF